MTKHTPGPWSLFKHYPTFINAGQTHIAIAFDEAERAPNASTAKANARLMAAAPDLLEALLGLISHIGNDGYIPGAGKQATEAARDAIAKATGESCERCDMPAETDSGLCVDCIDAGKVSSEEMAEAVERSAEYWRENPRDSDIENERRDR